MYVFSLFVLMFSLTGCVKFNSSMDIKADKSMDFSIIYAFDTSVFGDTEMLSNEDKSSMEKEGFTVTDYVDGTMKGVTLLKRIKNIDSVSSTEDTSYSLSGVLDDSENNSYLFKVKKGFFKNVYTAKFDFDSSDSGLNSFDDNDTTDLTDDFDLSIDEDTTDDFDLSIDDESNDESYVMEGDLTDGELDLPDLSSSMANLDLSFNVKLPFSAISSNATSTNNRNKMLSWTLSSQGSDSIEFSFALYNFVNIGIVACVSLLVIIILIVVLARKKGKKNNYDVKPIDSSVGVPELNNSNDTKQFFAQSNVNQYNQQPSDLGVQNVNLNNQPNNVQPDVVQNVQPSFVNNVQPTSVENINSNIEQNIQQNVVDNINSNIFEQPLIQPVVDNNVSNEEEIIDSINIDSNIQDMSLQNPSVGVQSVPPVMDLSSNNQQQSFSNNISSQINNVQNVETQNNPFNNNNTN